MKSFLFIFAIFRKPVMMWFDIKFDENGALKNSLEIMVFGDAFDQLLNFCGCKEALKLKIHATLVANDDVEAEVKIVSDGNALT